MKKLIAICLVILACSDMNKEKKFAQSAEIHDVAVKIGKDVEVKINKIQEQASKNEIREELLDSLVVLREDYREWQENLIEVPGYEHEHDHNHNGHDHHDHSSSSKLTPEMMLILQTELRNQISELNDRAQRLLESTTIKTHDKPDKE